MRLPRDISGRDLAKALGGLGYAITRQTGSHPAHDGEGGEHHVTVPDHDPLKVGTLNHILKDVAEHAGLTRDEVIQRLFG